MSTAIVIIPLSDLARLLYKSLWERHHLKMSSEPTDCCNFEVSVSSSYVYIFEAFYEQLSLQIVFDSDQDIYAAFAVITLSDRRVEQNCHQSGS